MRVIRESMQTAIDAPTINPPDAVAHALSHLPTPLLDVLASKAAGTDLHASNVKGAR